jgi:hypothetical protein
MVEPLKVYANVIRLSGPAEGSERRYSAGQKRCAMWELFIKWERGTVVVSMLRQ